MKQADSQFSILNSQLGGYTIRALLGSGGMASVYKGYDSALDREVAIKVISTANQPADFVSRFQREARLAASLRHANIVQIYHFGGQQNIVYMVQELLPGPTLEQHMHAAGRRRVASDRVLAIIEQLASSLDYAHSQGVIHRDIKPSNALYNANGQLVLTDFGIARSIADPGQTTTGPGVVMGTPGYLAPEQAISSVALTPTCDIYALGALLFELLTGRLPFEADTAMGVILKHLYDQPPRPSTLRPDLPSTLDTVVLRAMQKEPAERYPSAGALAKALRAAWPSARASTPKSARPAARSTPKNATPAPARPKAASAIAPKPAANTPAPSAAKRATPKSVVPKAAAIAAHVPAARPAAKPAAKARPTAAAVAIVAAAPPRRMWRLRVGLFTIALVSALILFGMYPNALGLAWETARELTGF